MTAEVKKDQYVYYLHETRSACDEVYYREEHLAPQFETIVKRITIEPAIKDWLIQALKESHHDETLYHQEALARLQAELKKIQHRLDQLYTWMETCLRSSGLRNPANGNWSKTG